MKLLNPGPVSTTQAVREALLRGDLCHREIECEQLLADVIHKLQNVYEHCTETYQAIVLTGSGTAAVEAMLTSCIAKTDRVLIVANGIYSYRIETIVKRYNKAYELLDFGLTGAIDYAEVAAKLQQGGFSQVAFVHHETTVGRLNDLEKMLSLSQTYQAMLLVDAVSSFGGEAIDFSHPNLLAVASSANKCLHGFSGISFVLVQKDKLDAMEHNAACLYLDLFTHYQSQIHDKVAFTPAIQILYALDTALTELQEQGGWQARHRHYLALSTALRDRFKQQGVELIIPQAQCASMLSTFHLPEGTDFASLHKYYKDNGYVIYPGRLNLDNHIFRMAVMGELSLRDIQRLDELMHAYLTEVNVTL